MLPSRPLTQDEAVDALKSAFAVGITAETATFDDNAKLCDSLVSKERTRIAEFMQRADGPLRDALGQAMLCMACTSTSMDACWRLPAAIRSFGGAAPRLTLGDHAPVVGKDREAARTRLIRRYDTFIAAALKCEERPISKKLLEELDELEDVAEALEPPDDNLREMAYELGGCLECGNHYLDFCDRAHFAVERAGKVLKRRPAR